MGLKKIIKIDSPRKKLEVLDKFKEDYNIKIGLGNTTIGFCIKYIKQKKCCGIYYGSGPLVTLKFGAGVMREPT